MAARRQQLDYHMKLHRFTIEDVPRDGSCFFHSLLIELQHHNYEDADICTAQYLRQRTCDYLQNNTAHCCYEADCPYLDLVENPQQFSSFDDFLTFMRKSTSYVVDYIIIINAAHNCFEVNITIIHDTRETCTNLSNDSYTTTVLWEI